MGLTGQHDSQARVLAFFHSLAPTNISLSERPLLYKKRADLCRLRSVIVVVLLNTIFSRECVLGLALTVYLL